MHCAKNLVRCSYFRVGGYSRNLRQITQMQDDGRWKSQNQFANSYNATFPAISVLLEFRHEICLGNRKVTSHESRLE
jgi:hypothetical protein